jgi:hypothetical protein
MRIRFGPRPALDLGGLDKAANLALILGAQLDMERSHVLLEARDAARAGDGDDVVALGEQPRERQLAGGDVEAGRNGCQPVDDARVGLAVGVHEPRHDLGARVLGVVERLGGAVRARQDAAAERRVAHDGDLERVRVSSSLLGFPFPFLVPAHGVWMDSTRKWGVGLTRGTKLTPSSRQVAR